MQRNPKLTFEQGMDVKGKTSNMAVIASAMEI